MVQASLKDPPYLDDPLRGMIFSSAVALGFSSIENVKYMLVHGPEVISFGPFSAHCHAGFSAFWGGALRYWTRQQASSNRSILSWGFLVPSRPMDSTITSSSWVILSSLITSQW